MKLFEWHSATFAPHAKQLPGFVEYLSGVWQNRNRYVEQSLEETTEEEQKEQDVQKQRFFDFTVDDKILARNYVGVVQYGDIRVEVYPKLFAGRDMSEAKQWQLNLLYWLRYCRKIKFPFNIADVSKLDLDDYLELLIYVFANYTSEILAQQPFQAYQTVEEETAFLKGRLVFDQYTKNNLITGRWQHFYCAHEPFVYDNLFNRIIKYVTRRLLAISLHGPNREKLNEILFLLHDVSDERCTAEDCARVKLNPLFDDHHHILELCRLYLSNQVIDMDSDDNRNFCFLFPMEYVFEDFIFGFIAEHWPSLNIKSQSTDFLALSQGKQVFQIRNDIYINNQLIIDTKYKIRKQINDRKEGVSQSDLYQMISYAIRRNCTEVLLLYPQVKGAINTPTSFQIPSAMFGTPLNIQVESIDVTFDDLKEADAVMKGRVELLHSVFNNLGKQAPPAYSKTINPI